MLEALGATDELLLDVSPLPADESYDDASSADEEDEESLAELSALQLSSDDVSPS